MPDISKCSGAGCPSRDKCWRYTSPATPHWQSYANFEDGLRGKDKCEAFWPVGGEDAD